MLELITDADFYADYRLKLTREPRYLELGMLLKSDQVSAADNFVEIYSQKVLAGNSFRKCNRYFHTTVIYR
jgi:hypothetical protein